MGRFVTMLVAALIAAPNVAHAEEPGDGGRPIAAAASREVDRLAGLEARRPMRGGLRWTGLAFAALGGTLVVYGSAQQGDGRCHWNTSCRDLRDWGRGLGGVMAGTGALLLVIGHATRGNDDDASARVPTVGVRDGGVYVAHRITF